MIQAGEIYDVGNDVDGKFSEEFKKYVHQESLVCRRTEKSISGLQFCISVFTKEEHEPGGFNSDVSFNHFLSDMALKFETGQINITECLVQFWRAEEVSNIVDGFVERSFQLTTRNQPFLLGDQFIIREEMCLYRMKTHDIIITGDGPISRAFKNNRIEFTPNVEYYSYEEYPQRDLALSCHIRCSLIVPLSDSYGRTVGVMEAVSPSFLFPKFIQYLVSYFQENNGCKDLCGQYDLEKDLLHSEMSEIKEVLEGVCESCDISFARTWILCKRCNSSFNSEICDQELSVSYWRRDEFIFPFFRSEICIMPNGSDEGIVGKAAASSHNFVYCNGFAKFSIAENPMALFARLHNLSACFAICLGSKHSEDRAHVLEFFLNSSSVKGRDLRAILFPKLNVMRHEFRTFKMASGGELRDSLSIQVIDASFPDKFETLEIGALDSIDNHTTEQQVVHNDDLAISNGENMIRSIDDGDFALASLGKQHNNAQISDSERIRELDHSTNSQQPLVEENVVYTEANVLGTSGECIINSSKSPYRRGGIDISLEELMGVIGMKRKDAAQRLNVSESTFKRVCRDYNILRWPPRKRNVEYQSSFSNSAQTASTKELGGIAPIVQNESLVTIKAKYGDKFIKFQLSASSGIDAFHHQVSKRLKLDARNYTVNYQDEENDWIIVACDDDLRDYISSSTLSGKNNLVISLEQI